jgi:hypothetical protein
MPGETIVTETPPLYSRYGRSGAQVRVPVTGSRARRIPHGAINVGTGDTALSVTKERNRVTHRRFLSRIRAHWRGWQVVLFEGRAPQHTAPGSSLWAECLGIEVRWLPPAAPELNAMDQLWRHVKRDGSGDRPTQSIDQSALAACGYVLALSPRERLRRAGALSGDFWLTK